MHQRPATHGHLPLGRCKDGFPQPRQHFYIWLLPHQTILGRSGAEIKPGSAPQHCHGLLCCGRSELHVFGHEPGMRGREASGHPAETGPAAASSSPPHGRPQDSGWQHPLSSLCRQQHGCRSWFCAPILCSPEPAPPATQGSVAAGCGLIGTMQPSSIAHPPPQNAEDEDRYSFLAL